MMWNSRGAKTEHGWPMDPGDELGTPWRQIGNSREELEGFWSCLQMWGRVGSPVMKSHMDMEHVWSHSDGECSNHMM